MKVKTADTAPSFARPSKVRGSEHTQQIRNMMTEKVTVLQLTSLSAAVMVLRYLAPTRTWRPWINCRGGSTSQIAVAQTVDMD